MTTTTGKVRLMSETFAIRDDTAACDDCDWTWKQPDRPAPFDVRGGGQAAKRHALDKGHRTTIRRVQFIRHTGIEDEVVDRLPDGTAVLDGGSFLGPDR